MRQLIGIGTPRGLQDRRATVMAALLALLGATRRWLVAISAGAYRLYPRVAAALQGGQRQLRGGRRRDPHLYRFPDVAVEGAAHHQCA